MGKTKPPREITSYDSKEFEEAFKKFMDPCGAILYLQTEEPTFHQLETQQQIFIQNCNNCGANDWEIGEQFSYCNYCRSSIILPTNKPFAIVTSISDISRVERPRSINIKN